MFNPLLTIELLKIRAAEILQCSPDRLHHKYIETQFINGEHLFPLTFLLTTNFQSVEGTCLFRLGGRDSSFVSARLVSYDKSNVLPMPCNFFTDHVESNGGYWAVTITGIQFTKI